MALRDLFEIVSWVQWETYRTLPVESDAKKPCLVTARWELEEYSRKVEGVWCVALLMTTPDLSWVYPNSLRPSPSLASIFRVDFFVLITSLLKTLDWCHHMVVARTDRHKCSECVSRKVDQIIKYLTSYENLFSGRNIFVCSHFVSMFFLTAFDDQFHH